MEKLRLKSLHSKGEVLSRAQLKKVLGGTGSGGGSGSANIYCKSRVKGQYPCDLTNIMKCLDACVDTWGNDCYGCSQAIPD